MKRITIALALAATSLLTGSAMAAGWADYGAAFPAFPCQDGWMGCVVDGKIVTPDLQKSASGVPQPADLRIGWDLQPTAAFSPFPGLSQYTGELPPAPEQVAAVEPPPEPEAPTPASSGSSSGSSGSSSSGSSSSGSSSSSSGSASSSVASSGSAESSSSSSRPPVTTPSSAKEPSGTTAPTTAQAQPAEPTPTASSSSVRPGGAVRPGFEGSSGSSETASTSAASSTTTAAAVPTPSSGTAERTRTAETGTAATSSIQVGQTTAAVAVVQDDSCDNLTKLEPMAMLGKLSVGHIKCLEGEYKTVSKQTDKDKISRVLMANSYAKGDTASWEKLMKRHLEEIDQSDPDLCYKYALHLSKRGAGRATGVIRWANVALENRTVWTGETYTSRVTSLYKLRAAAAQSLWKAAEEEHAAAPTDTTKKKVEDSRNQTKVFAREWYEYCKSAGKDTTTALQLCISAAGTKDYCEAG